jgi:hypothetical protein
MSLKSFLTDNLPTIQFNSESFWSKLSYWTSGGAAATGALTLNEFLMIIGTILAMATFAVNFYYKRQSIKMQRAREAREDELHRARMMQLFKPESSDG